MRQPTSPFRVTRTELRPIEQLTMKGGPPSATFAAWSDRLEVYSEYIAALAKYKRETAVAERAQAEAEGDLAMVRAKSLVLKELETYGRLLHKVRQQHAREAALATARGERAINLLAGRRIAGSLAATWSCFAWFESRALIESASELYAVRLESSARKAQCFFDNRDESLSCEDAPRNIDTAIGLANWLHQRSYLPRKNSAANEALTELIAVINQIAARTVAELRLTIVEMRNGTALAWQPRIVLGITPSAVASRIEFAGIGGSVDGRSVDASPKRGRPVLKPPHRTRIPVKNVPAWVGMVGDQA